MGATGSRHRQHQGIIDDRGHGSHDEAIRQHTFVGKRKQVAIIDFHSEVTTYPALFVKPSLEGSHAVEQPAGAAKSVAQPLSEGVERRHGPTASKVQQAQDVGQQQQQEQQQGASAASGAGGGGVDTANHAQIVSSANDPGALQASVSRPSGDVSDLGPVLQHAESEDVVDVPEEESEDLYGTHSAGRRNLVYVMTLAMSDKTRHLGAQQQQQAPASGWAHQTANAVPGRTWRIRRTLGDFLNLHRGLRQVLGWSAPDFPKQHRFRYLGTRRAVRAIDPQSMTRRLRQYLSACLELPAAMDLVPLRQFLEVSRTSFDPVLGWKGKEGMLLAAYDALFVRGVACAMSWRPYWFALRDGYLAAYDDSRCLEPSQALLLDEATDVYSGAAMPVATCGTLSCLGSQADARTITIITAQGRVLLAATSKREADDWITSIRERMRHCLYAQRQPLGSFAPPRRGMLCRWFVDGRNMYEAVIQAMQMAKHEVLITGWWLTPDLAILRETADVAASEGPRPADSAGGAATGTAAGSAVAEGELPGGKPRHLGHKVKDWVEDRLGFDEEATGTPHRLRDKLNPHKAPPGAHYDGSELNRPEVIDDVGDAEFSDVGSGATTAAAVGTGAASGRHPAVNLAAPTLQEQARAYAPQAESAAGYGGGQEATSEQLQPMTSPSRAPEYGAVPTSEAAGGLAGMQEPLLPQPFGVPVATAVGQAPPPAATSTAGLGAPPHHRHLSSHPHHHPRASSALASEGGFTAFDTAAQEQGVPAEVAQRIRLTLKQVIKDRAEAGCRVFINMYQEPPMSMALDSLYQKRVLQSLHPNVNVIRHGKLFWSHHEKIVVVDRKIAFIGGLDISWGRWDTGAHVVVDPDRHVFPQNLEYYQPAVADWAEVEDIWTERVDRQKYPKMSWHDVHMCMRGPSVQDIVRHFVQRWNFTRADKDKTQLPVLLPHGPWPGYVPRPVGLHLLPGLMVDAGTQTSADDLTFGPPRPLPGVIAAPGATDAGATTAAYDVTGTAAAGTGAAGNGTGGTPPGAGGDGGHEPIHVLLHRWLQRARERKDKGLPPPKPTKPPAYPTADTKWYCTSDWTQQWCKSNVQILRSAGEWSLGTSTENSIYHSYLHAILNAEHFLYIENQYVISALGWTKEAMAELQIAEGQADHHITSEEGTEALMSWILGDRAMKKAKRAQGGKTDVTASTGHQLRQESIEEHASAAAAEEKEDGGGGGAGGGPCAPDVSSLPGHSTSTTAAAAAGGSGAADAGRGQEPPGLEAGAETAAAAEAAGGSHWAGLHDRLQHNPKFTAARIIRGRQEPPAGKLQCEPDRAAGQSLTRSGISPAVGPKHHTFTNAPGREPAYRAGQMPGRKELAGGGGAHALLAETLGKHQKSRAGSRGDVAAADQKASFPKSSAAAASMGGVNSAAGVDELFTPSERRRAAAVVAIWRRRAKALADAAPAADRSLRLHPVAAAPSAAGARGPTEDAELEEAPFGELELPESRAALLQGQVVEVPESSGQQGDVSGTGGSSGGGIGHTDAPRQPLGSKEVSPAESDDTPPATEGVLSWAPDRNPWAEALYIRLVRAITNKENFKAVIVLPVHPDGPLRANRAIQLVLHWEAATISRGGWSLLERLQRRFPDVDLSQYVEFFCLRNYAWLNGKAVTEQVYVHSKLLIADDRLVIMGSANLNDRSLYGDRDSEIAAIITGGDKVITRLGGMPWRSTVFAHTLRRNLMEEHTGLSHTCHYFSLTSGSQSTSSREVVLPDSVPQQATVGREKTRVDNAHVPFVPLRLIAPQEKHYAAAKAAADSGGQQQPQYESLQQEPVADQLPIYSPNAVESGAATAVTSGVSGLLPSSAGYAGGDPNLAAGYQQTSALGKGATAFNRTSPDQPRPELVGLGESGSDASINSAVPTATLASAEPLQPSLFGSSAASANGDSAYYTQGGGASSAISTYGISSSSELNSGVAAPEAAFFPPQFQPLPQQREQQQQPMAPFTQPSPPVPADTVMQPQSAGEAASAEAGTLVTAGVPHRHRQLTQHRGRVFSLAATHMLPSDVGPTFIATGERTSGGSLIAESERLTTHLEHYGPGGAIITGGAGSGQGGGADEGGSAEGWKGAKAVGEGPAWSARAPSLSEALAETDRILTNVASLQAECACDAFTDPLDSRFYNGVWLASARLNTRIFDSVFPDIMKDEIKTMQQWKDTDGKDARRTELLAALVGKLSVWPKAFLEQEALGTRPTEKEHYLPSRVTQ